MTVGMVCLASMTACASRSARRCVGACQRLSGTTHTCDVSRHRKPLNPCFRGFLCVWVRAKPEAARAREKDSLQCGPQRWLHLWP